MHGIKTGMYPMTSRKASTSGINDEETEEEEEEGEEEEGN